MKSCRTAVKADKGNYTAWLFAGKAACEIDPAELPNSLQQAEQAYRKAIEIDSKNALAWKVCDTCAECSARILVVRVHA